MCNSWCFTQLTRTKIFLVDTCVLSYSNLSSKIIAQKNESIKN